MNKFPLYKPFVIVGIASCLWLAGCQSGEPDVTPTDKENIERLHKDGIGKVMAEDAKRKGVKGEVSLANPTGGPGPEAQGP